MPSVGVSSERLHEVALWPVTEPAAAAQLARFAFTNAVADSAPSSLNAQIHCESVRPSRLYYILEFSWREKSSKGALNGTSQKFESQSLFFYFSFGVSLVHFLSKRLPLCSSRLHMSLRGRAFPSYRQLKACFPQKSTRKKLVSSNVNEICSGASRSTGDI